MSNNSTISVRMFVQRHRANAAGKAPIFARIRLGSECTTIGTKLYVLPEHWALDKTIGFILFRRVSQNANKIT